MVAQSKLEQRTASQHQAVRFATAKPLAVVTTMTGWHEPPRIRHQVTRQLLRFYNVMYVELGFTAASDGFEQAGPDLLIFRPRGLSWLQLKLRTNVQYFQSRRHQELVRKIEKVIRDLGYQTAALVNFQFDFPEIMTSSVFRRSIYLCNDDFQHASRSWVRTMNERAEHAVIATAHAALAVSLPLLDKLKRVTGHAQLFLPGHDFEIPDRDAIARSLRRRVRPIRVCYMGFLNDRLRLDWLAHLIRDPHIRLTLIGPIEVRESWTELLSSPNVEHLDTLVGDALQTRLQAADVFVMPYDVRMPTVRAITAPNKLFQYLACGRPVVCSNLPSLIQLPGKFMYVAADAEQFAGAVRRAFDEDDAAATLQRLEYSLQNTWSVRGDSLHNLIEQAAVK